MSAAYVQRIDNLRRIGLECMFALVAVILEPNAHNKRVREPHDALVL
jgi:hypothetical protein